MGRAAKKGRKVKWRIGDLFYYNIETHKTKHSLTKKLLEEKRFKDINEIRSFYRGDDCTLKIIQTDKYEETIWLEHLLIGLLRPKYND